MISILSWLAYPLVVLAQCEFPNVGPNGDFCSVQLQEREMTIQCGKRETYRGEWQSRRETDYVVVQGVASPQSPKPPSIFIRNGSGDTFEAALNVDGGQYAGQCRTQGPDAESNP